MHSRPCSYVPLKSLFLLRSFARVSSSSLFDFVCVSTSSHPRSSLCRGAFLRWRHPVFCAVVAMSTTSLQVNFSAKSGFWWCINAMHRFITSSELVSEVSFFLFIFVLEKQKVALRFPPSTWSCWSRFSYIFLDQWLLLWGGRQSVQGGREPLCALQRGKFDQ